ncbi:hypothetical protein ACKWTF_011200 [Chironomus riparius]
MSEKNFIHYVKINLSIFKYVGFAAFSIDKNNQVYITLMDVFCYAASSCIGIFIIYNSWLQNDVKVDKNFLIDFGNLISANVAVVISLISMLLYFIEYKKIWQLVLFLHKVDEQLISLGLKLNHMLITLFYFSVTVANFILIMVPLNIAMNRLNMSMSNILIYNYSGMYFSLSMGGVLTISLCFLIRSKNILDAIKLNFRFLEDQNSFQVRDNKRETQVMVKLNQIYHDLFKALEKASHVGGLCSLLGYFLCFVFSIYTGFVCYKALTTSDTQMKQKAIFTVLWFLYLIFFPALITILGEAVEQNVNCHLIIKI